VHRLELSDIEDRVLSRLLPAQAEHNGDTTWLMAGTSTGPSPKAATQWTPSPGASPGWGSDPGTSSLSCWRTQRKCFRRARLARLGAVHHPHQYRIQGRISAPSAGARTTSAVVVDEALSERLSSALSGLQSSLSWCGATQRHGTLWQSPQF